MGPEDRRQERFNRIRRLKKILRPLPRRSNVHRYPVLSWFSATARKRMDLWSFRRPEVIPALYAGWILTLMPLYGAQILLAVLAALLFRCNVMILVGLQLVSNPLTVIPLWYINYLVGDFFLSLVLGPSAGMIDILLTSASEAGMNFRQAFELILERTRESGARFMTDVIGRVVGAIFLGAIVLGLFAGLVSSLIYQYFSNRWIPSYDRLANEARKQTLDPASPKNEDSYKDTSS